METEENVLEETDAQEIDPVEELLPAWVEFSRMANEKEIHRAVVAFFGDTKATADDFKRIFGIDLNNYKNYYMETGADDAPTGPLLGGRLSPILVIRQSNSGQTFTAHIFKHDGLINENLKHAWIARKEWEEHVNDTFAEELKQRAQKAREGQKEAQQKLLDMQPEMLEKQKNGEE